jgi:hypothetical protein
MNKQLPMKLDNSMRGVTHHLAHRTRYKLASHHRNAKTVSKLQESLKLTAGIINVEYNPRTGSLLVHHVESPEMVNNVSNVLNTVAGDLFEELAEENLGLPGVSMLAQLIAKRFDKLNQYLAYRTNSYIDLKMLLPLLFMGAGLFQISKEKAAFSQVPAWVLFYYAYDSYLKFHNQTIGLSTINNSSNGHSDL